MTRQVVLDRRSLRSMERMLMAKRDALREALRRPGRLQLGAGAARLTDPASWASESLEGEMAAALLEQRTREVAQIEAALRRLARQEYGLCQDCDGLIGLERLRALPFARRCLPCQARAEAAERRSSPAAVAPPGDD